MSALQFKLPTMLTIKETAEYCKKNGAPKITQFRIRQLAKDGNIVCVPAGRKYLINLDKFIEYLNNGEVQALQENVSQITGITKIPVKI